MERAGVDAGANMLVGLEDPWAGLARIASQQTSHLHEVVSVPHISILRSMRLLVSLIANSAVKTVNAKLPYPLCTLTLSPRLT